MRLLRKKRWCLVKSRIVCKTIEFKLSWSLLIIAPTQSFWRILYKLIGYCLRDAASLYGWPHLVAYFILGLILKPAAGHVLSLSLLMRPSHPRLTNYEVFVAVWDRLIPINLF